jgi:UDP-4-amino-4,6-dideoxy-N-acetyl-beta-L-altrosamine N-acetyltransferase
MKFFNFGITFRRITEKDIELVRKWRNSPRISQFMEYREYITPEMQKKWYESINNCNNFYAIVEYKNEKIGLINDKNIDWKARTSESGLFLWEEKYYITHIPVLISIAGIEFFYNYFNWNKTYARILKTNHNATKYCTNLGYTLCDGQEHVENQLYILTRQSYEQKAKKIREMAIKMAGPHTKEYLFIEDADYENGLTEIINNIKLHLDSNIKSKSVKEGEIFYRE